MVCEALFRLLLDAFIAELPDFEEDAVVETAADLLHSFQEDTGKFQSPHVLMDPNSRMAQSMLKGFIEDKSE